MAKITELPPDDDRSANKSNTGSSKQETQEKPKEEERKNTTSLKNTTGVLYINYILLPIIVAVVSIVFLYTQGYKGTQRSPGKKADILMTAKELAEHDGSNPDIPIYIAILGRVYDVDKGKQHYGKDSGYNVFAGRDSTPSFVTGQFSREMATDDVTGLSAEEMLGIKDWMDFYRNDYTHVGKVIGRYYDENGKPTDALKQAKKLIKEGQQLKNKQKDEDKKFPPCNSKWSQSEGSEVWCSQSSGGIQRSWSGVPRQLFKPGNPDPKCVCIRTSGPSSDSLEGNEGDLNHPNLKLYPGCKKMDIACKLSS